MAGWRGDEEEIPNPMSAEEAAERVLRLWDRGMHAVSVTGGEPLLQAEELAGFLPLLRREGMPVYLETNGTLHAELARVLGLVDWISMDLKLPSALGGVDLLEEQRFFLRLARSRRVFLKCVIEPGTGEGELEDACRALSLEAADVPLVLQLATPPPGGERIAPRRAFELCGLAAAYFREVRVLPQLHRLWGIE